MTVGSAALDQAYSTVPSGRVDAPVTVPVGVGSAVVEPSARSRRCSVARPRCSACSSSDRPSSYQSAARSPGRSSSGRSVCSPVVGSHRKGSGRPVRSCSASSRGSPSTGENAEHRQALALAVVEVGDHLAVDGQHAQRLVAGVAALAVLDHQQPLVAGQAGQVGVLLVPVEHLGAGRADDVDGAAVVVGAAGRGQGAAELEAGGVGGWHARQRLGVRAALPGLRPPDAELVAVGVVEPPDRAAVGGQGAVARAVGPVGHLPGGAGVAVPGVQLEGARDVRDVEAPGGRVLRPVREGHPRCAEPLLPDRCVAHGPNLSSPGEGTSRGAGR